MIDFEFSDRGCISMDLLYDLFYGGYIKPRDLLADESQALAVEQAVETIREFLAQAEEAEILEVR